MDKRETEKNKENNLSPAMKQYVELKKQYCNEFLFFQMGDFYEMFYDDAKNASEILGITLTSRNKDSNGPIPMCGIPCHSSDSYCVRLLDEGYKVAICNQVENASESKGIVKRKVVRVLTPGTSIVGDHLTESKESQFLLSIAGSSDEIHKISNWGISWIDVTTGDFSAVEVPSDIFERRLDSELERLRPKEILLGNKKIISPRMRYVLENFDARIEEISELEIDSKDSFKYLQGKNGKQKIFKRLDSNSPLFAASANLIKYLERNQLGDLPHIKPIDLPDANETMFLDAVTQSNLELVYQQDKNSKADTLFSVLDNTSTSMGGRLLKKWILSPLINLKKIKQRTDAVDELKKKKIERKKIIEYLSNIRDLERIQSKIGLQSSNERDLKSLADSIIFLPKINKLLNSFKSKEINSISSNWNKFIFSSLLYNYGPDS